MYQQSPKHQLINRLNNACIKLTCAYIILHHVKFILYKKCNIWHWYKEHPQTTHWNCFIRAYDFSVHKKLHMSSTHGYQNMKKYVSFNMTKDSAHTLRPEYLKI